MKRTALKWSVIAGLAFGILAFSPEREGAIQGSVTPVEAVKEVVAVAGTDTLRSEMSGGTFVFSNVKKGTYTVWVRAIPPYQDTSVENVAVADSATTNIGEIKLIQ